MSPLYALLAIIAVFVLLGWVFSRVDGLALFAPKSTKRVASSAHTFCTEQCRPADGTCPLAAFGKQPEDCPLWQFIEADLPTAAHGNPFAHLRAS